MSQARPLVVGHRALSFKEAIPLSLYIHLPWCIKKCPYCDFNSHPLRTLPEAEYIEHLIKDCEASLPLIWGRPIKSIFIGGGTPSLFSGQSITYLLDKLRALLPIHPNTEITLEANPGASEAQRFKQYRAAGVNRLSIGVQSFNNESLKHLGRVHDAQEATLAFKMAREAGFDHINIDIMYALPQQSLEEAMQDLQQAIALDPGHISWYQLTLEPNTFFHKYPPKVPLDDALIDMEEAGLALLEKNGYKRYEISAFGKTHRCQHNLNYWQFGDYLGIGAGAHSKITLPHEHRIVRVVKNKHPTLYMSSPQYVAEQTTLDIKDIPLEYMLNAARLIDGFSLNDFENNTGLMRSVLNKGLEQSLENKLITLNGDQVCPTALGVRFTNDRISEFLP